MTSLLIIWHSRTGGSEHMAAAAASGAHEQSADVGYMRADKVSASHLLAADGFLFACPENLASMSGAMKEFFDRCYYPVLGQIEGRPYATMICAGSDGEGAARQIARIALGWRLKPIADPLIICTHAQSTEAILAAKSLGEAELERCRELGATLAAGLAIGIF